MKNNNESFSPHQFKYYYVYLFHSFFNTIISLEIKLKQFFFTIHFTLLPV